MQNLPITQTLQLNQYQGNCPQTIDDLRQWLESAEIKLNFADNFAFGYTKGSEEPGVDYRSLPWHRFDNEERFLGIYYWSTAHNKWVRGGLPGELLTKYRSEATVATDLERWGLGDAWVLADGKTPGIPNLTANAGFFWRAIAEDTDAEWDFYTVGYVG